MALFRIHSAVNDCETCAVCVVFFPPCFIQSVQFMSALRSTTLRDVLQHLWHDPGQKLCCSGNSHEYTSVGRILKFGKQTRGKLGGLWLHLMVFYMTTYYSISKWIQKVRPGNKPSRISKPHINSRVVLKVQNAIFLRFSPIYTRVLIEITASLSPVPDPQHFGGRFFFASQNYICLW